MARKKYTEKEVVEFIKNVDIDFLNAYVPYFTNLHIVNSFEKKKQELEEKIQETENKIDELFKEKKIKLVYEFSHSQGTGYERENIYAEYLFLGTDKLYLGESSFNGSNWKKEFKVRRLVDFLQNYQKDQAEFNNYGDKEEVEKYILITKAIKELEEDKEGKNFLVKLSINKKIKSLIKEREKLEKVNSFKIDAEKYIKIDKDLKDKKEAYEKVSLILPEILSEFEIYNKKLNRLKNELSKYKNHILSDENKESFAKYQEYCQSKYLTEKIKEDAKDFKLTKFYVEHEKDFAENEKTLADIYVENIKNEGFFDYFERNLKQYNRAKIIAKNKGKNFKEICDTEKFEYFEEAEDLVKERKSAREKAL